MSSAEASTNRTTIAGYLSGARSQTEAGNFKEALATLKEAKNLEPRNIYILAFEKQVEQLIELAEMNILTDEHRSDILESIPGIIERALEGKAGAPGGPSLEARAALEREREEKAAALEWLKNQYFQHAHEYVRKGEYQNALTEIRRVYIIEPANRIAKDFEQQIEQLISLHKVQTVTKPHFRTMRPAGKAGAVGGDSSGRVHSGTTPSTNAQESPSPSPGPESPATEAAAGKRKMSPAVIIGIIVALIAALFALYYFSGDGETQQSPVSANPKVPAPPSAKALSPAPAGTAELRFMISLIRSEGKLSPQVAREGGESRPVTMTLESEPLAAGDTVLEEAKLLSIQNPKFPSFSYAAALDGQVVVQVEIDPEGSPGQTKIVRSTNELLDVAVIDAVSNATFSPRRTRRGPVSSTATIPFTFRQKQ